MNEWANRENATRREERWRVFVMHKKEGEKKKTRCSSYKDNSRMHWVYLHACLSFVVSTSRKRIIQRQRKAKKKKKLQVEKKNNKKQRQNIDIVGVRTMDRIYMYYTYIYIEGWLNETPKLATFFFYSQSLLLTCFIIISIKKICAAAMLVEY